MVVRIPSRKCELADLSGGDRPIGLREHYLFQGFVLGEIGDSDLSRGGREEEM